jgi:hypothetical protein
MVAGIKKKVRSHQERKAGEAQQFLFLFSCGGS